MKKIFDDDFYNDRLETLKFDLYTNFDLKIQNCKIFNTGIILKIKNIKIKINLNYFKNAYITTLTYEIVRIIQMLDDKVYFLKRELLYSYNIKIMDILIDGTLIKFKIKNLINKKVSWYFLSKDEFLSVPRCYLIGDIINILDTTLKEFYGGKNARK